MGQPSLTRCNTGLALQRPKLQALAAADSSEGGGSTQRLKGASELL